MAFDFFDAGKRVINRTIGDNLTNTAFRAVGSKIDDVSQPQLAYMWEISFKGIFSSNAKNITLYAIQASIPSIATDPIKRFYAGVPYSYSGKDTSPRVVRVTFWDNQNLDIYRYFLQWTNSMNDVGLKRKARPLNYKRDISIALKDTTDGIVNGEFNFSDCYPTEVGEVSLSYVDSSAMQFDVTFSFDSRGTSGDIVTDLLNQGTSIIASSSLGEVVDGAVEGFRRWF